MSDAMLRHVPAYEAGELRLVGNRITLRRPVITDAKRVATFMGDFDVVKNLSRAPWPYALEDAESWLGGVEAIKGPRPAYPFAITTPEGLIGVVGISTNPQNPEAIELGYWLGKPYWNQGYVSESARLALRFAFSELDLPGIEAGFFIDNPASGRVLEKLGFIKTKDVLRYSKARDCDVTCRMMVLSRTRFESLDSQKGGPSHGG
jgi:RimJ/RimL family protein N-acetyltransferase